MLFFFPLEKTGTDWPDPEQEKWPLKIPGQTTPELREFSRSSFYFL
jgi:hypothetical protein